MLTTQPTPISSTSSARGASSTRRLRCPLVSVLAASLLAVPALQAEFLQPVAVQVSNGDATQDALINGLGFDVPGVGSPGSIHNRNAGDTWSGIGSIRESATFDLGATVSLTKVYIWNYNVVDATDVGMKDVEIQVSSGTDMATATFSAIARISLTEGGETAQTFDVVGTSVRLVRLKGLSNWGQGYTVGLAEVRFESGVIAGNVPYVSIISPLEGDEIAFGTDILIDTTVTDLDGLANVQQVEFFDGDTLLTNKTASPYLFVHKGATNGPHTFRTVVTDRTGKVSWSSVNVTVRTLVADRIEKIDDTLNQGTGLAQISYSGAWNLAQGGASDPRYLNNDHYDFSNNRNDYFEVRFKGVKIDVFATVASHHGNGWASIDGGAESKVIYKAAQRAEQVLVWSSPILANREHVLKIRVAGDGVVTADRFDVSVSDTPDVTTATVKEITATFTSVIVKLEDNGFISEIVPETVRLTLDHTPVVIQVVKDDLITTAIHVPASPFAPGSTHSLLVEATDTEGITITNLSTFTLPSPPFPLTGLGGPASTAGQWGFRQIWNAGRADAVSSAVAIALDASQAGFGGTVSDTATATVNFALSSNPGTPGLFPNPQPLPAEAEGLSVSDFVIVATATVRIPRSGDWTIGTHSDDGFALRFIGAPFDSVNGTGGRDDDFPEYMAFLVPGETMTRGILRGINAGTYSIEFIGFQRAASAHFDLYAAEGAFDADGATDQWQLIGSAGGLEIVSGAKLKATSITKQADTVTIDFTTPQPDGPHQLLESVNLIDWQNVQGASFINTGASSARVTVNGVTGAARYYRIVQP